MDRKQDRRFRTSDRVLIVDGLRVWDYDLKSGTVCFSESRIDSEHWDGWFQVLTDDGSGSLMNGVRLCTVHPFTREPVPPFVDEFAGGRRAVVETGARLIPVVEHDPAYEPPVIEWSPRVPTDPRPWVDTVTHRRYRSTEVTPYICDYCDQPATLVSKDSDDVLCETDARDQHTRWRLATRPLSTRDVTQRLRGWPVPYEETRLDPGP